MMVVYIVVGQDTHVRGFAYTIERYAQEGAREADGHWPAGAPHRVVPFIPDTRGRGPGVVKCGERREKAVAK